MSVPDLYKIPHETPDFVMPPQGTPMLVEYLQSLEMPNGDSLLLKAVNNMPDADIRMLLQNTPDDPRSFKDRVSNSACMLTINLLANRICEQCGDKSDIKKLSICGSCALAWYCSKECQEKHWPTHKLRCCKKDGPLNKGFQAIAFVKTK